jgi:hypothetical protein
VGGGLIVHAASTQALFTVGAGGAVLGAALVAVDRAGARQDSPDVVDLGSNLA